MLSPVWSLILRALGKKRDPKICVDIEKSESFESLNPSISAPASLRIYKHLSVNTPGVAAFPAVVVPASGPNPPLLIASKPIGRADHNRSQTEKYLWCLQGRMPPALSSLWQPRRSLVCGSAVFTWLCSSLCLFSFYKDTNCYELIVFPQIPMLKH